MHATTSSRTSDWYLDTCVNTHVTYDLSQLQYPTPYHDTETIIVSNGHTLLITHTGSGSIHTPHGKYHLHSLNHVPSLTSNLLSVHRFTKDNKCTLVFNANNFQVVGNDTNLVQYTSPCEHGLYALPAKPIPIMCQAVTTST